MSSERVLVTGIDGFTGRYLRKRLEMAGWEVWGTSLFREAERTFRCDLRDLKQIIEVVEEVRPVSVVHLAGIAFTEESDANLIYAVNVLGSENLLRALERVEESTLRTVILASSATVYGVQEESVLSEELCPRPVQHYGISKLAMERIAETYFDRLPILITRPFNYTGPGQEERFVIPKIVRHFRDRSPVLELGNLDVSREFNDVRYIVDCYVRLLESGVRSRVVNLASGWPVSLRTVLRILEKLTGYRPEIRINPAFVRAREIPSLAGSVEALSKCIDLPELRPIEETLQWMLEADPNRW